MADTNEQSNVDSFMKVREVAELFDVTSATVREWLKAGDLKGVKIGKGHYWRIKRSSVSDLATRRYGMESQND